jgi:hypothetical protein
MSMRLKISGFVVNTIKDIEERWIDLIPTFSATGVVRYGHRIYWLPSSPEDVLHSTGFWTSRLNHMHSLEEALKFPVTDNGRNNTPPRRPACFQDQSGRLPRYGRRCHKKGRCYLCSIRRTSSIYPSQSRRTLGSCRTIVSNSSLISAYY